MNTIIAELPKVVPNSHVISSKGCECRSDRLHFTPAGYREPGKRYAEKIGGKMPSMAHAGVYAATLHYLKAVEALKDKDSAKVMTKMKEMLK